MHERAFEPKNVATETLDRVLEASIADETELVWFERRHGRATWPPPADDAGGPPDLLEQPRLTVLVRVVEGGRPGWHRTEVRTVGEMENAVRHALAVSKTQPKARRRPVLPTHKGSIEKPKGLFDRAVIRLDVDSARAQLREWLTQGDEAAEEHREQAILAWSETRLLVANSHGLRRSINTTELDLDVRSGEGPGSGRAASSARTFKALDPQKVIARARGLRTDHDAHPAPPSEAVPVLLSPEAVAQLLHVLNTFALAGRAYLDGTSFLTRHRSVQVFDRAVHLRDDGRRAPGVPFPFDLEGSPKVACDLIKGGTPSTPALTQQQGAEAGLVSTAQSIGGQDALFGNLFLEPGEASHDELLAAADGGLYVGWLDPAECLEPTQLHLRAIARSVRRIEGGKLGAPLPDLCWETSLLASLARLGGIGSEVVVRTVPSTPLGAVCAPALVVAQADGFSLLD